MIDKDIVIINPIGKTRESVYMTLKKMKVIDLELYESKTDNEELSELEIKLSEQQVDITRKMSLLDEAFYEGIEKVKSHTFDKDLEFLSNVGELTKKRYLELQDMLLYQFKNIALQYVR